MKTERNSIFRMSIIRLKYNKLILGKLLRNMKKILEICYIKTLKN